MNFIYNNEGRNSIYVCPKCHRVISIKVKQDIEIIPDDNQDLDKIEALLFHPSAMVYHVRNAMRQCLDVIMNL